MIGNQCSGNQYSVTRRGFTLIELLVVIAIIAALAALVTGVGRTAYRARVESRVKTELHMLVGAIEAYHKKFGFYPPDNANDSTRPPLYYELVGWTGTANELGDITNAFGVGGFVNSDPERKNFLANLKPKGFTAIPGRTPPIYVLTFPAVGPGAEGAFFNTWNYRSTKPTNNTESFDLWINLILSSKTNTISNWKE
jgi:prepilin-type N-terminal cleavage/methylation domain-containing protein